MATSTKAKKTKTAFGSKPQVPMKVPGGVQNNEPGSSVFVPDWVIQQATGYKPAAAAKPSAPASPAAPANPYGQAGSQAAPDSPYADALRVAMQRRDEQIARLRAQGQTTLKESGVTGQFDLQDQGGALGVTKAGLAIGDDTYLDANPLSAAARIRDAYRQNASGSRTNLASQGQLYSGAMQNSADSLAKDNNDRRQELLNAVDKALGGYADAGRGAYIDYATEGNAAMGDLVARTEAGRQAWSEANPAPAPAAASAAPARHDWSSLRGPNGEQLHVTSKGTYYVRKSDGKAIYIKRNK